MRTIAVMSEQDSKDWQRLARLAVHRRIKLGYRTQKDFTEASGIKIRTLNNIENARQPGYDGSTIAMLELGLQWEPGSVDAALAGGDPIVSSPEVAEPAAKIDRAELEELRATLVAALDRIDRIQRDAG